jgi:two-component system, OmpR family, response regulator ArlR
MYILLIEDNKDISDNIRQYLELDGYKVATSFRWDDWEKTALSFDFDLILLDLTLPWKDGIEVCKNIVQKKDTPIIMITAREDIDSKTLGFEAGAWDYIVKPFHLKEISIRIKNLLKRKESHSNFTFWDIEIDLPKRKFSKKWVSLHLPQKEFLIIEILLKQKWNIVSRTDIIEYIWWWEDALFESDAKLDVYISNLRSKFWKDFIETIKGVGYRIEG